MKKKHKIIIIIFIVWASFVVTDFTLSRFDKRPIFAVPIKVYKDGGSVEYYGLGYKVIKYNTLDSFDSECLDLYALENPELDTINAEETECEIILGKKNAVFGFWTLQFKND
jgi:hypothetical protein